jgi:hypothetical protein
MVNGKQIQGAAMMVMAFGILVVPGIVVNNLQNNGIIQPYGSSNCNATNNFCMTCTSLDGGTCVLTAKTGCSVSATYCQLQGSSIAFLNACSPFTNILTLNYAGFVSSFFTNCGQAQSQTANLIGVAGASNGTVYTLSACETVAGPGPVQLSIVTECQDVNPSIITSLGTVNSNCPVGGLTCIGLDLNTPVGACASANNWNGVIGNSTEGSTPTATIACIYGTIIPSGCNSASCYNILTMTASCLVYGDYYGSIVNASNAVTSATCTSLTVMADSQSPNNSVGSGGIVSAPGSTLFSLSKFNVGSLLTFLLTIIGAALFLFLSLGVGGSIQGSVVATGGAVSVTNNPQGTKLAQTLGIALVLWSPLYSEFSSWFTSGYLPFGLDGTIGIISVALIATVFVGAYFISQSGTAGSQ